MDVKFSGNLHGNTRIEFMVELVKVRVDAHARLGVHGADLDIKIYIIY
jgi:hypothetical protein